MESLIENPQGTGERPPVCINQTPLALSSDITPFRLTSTTYERYRFIQCDAFLAGAIKVYEYKELPKSYAVISYVWYGVDQSSEDESPTIQVYGKNQEPSGLPISIEMIKDACRAVLAHKDKLNLLWLDRFCIDKSDENDDNWQTEKMHKIYKSSSCCIVFPGGLTRLTSLSEKTTWVDRGWTLQEALAPSEVQVVFKWTSGNKSALPDPEYQYGTREITVITPGRCAMAPLSLILDCAITGELFIKDGDSFIHEDLSISMFGVNQGTDDGCDFRRVLPGVAALAVLLNLDMAFDPGRRDHCIWKSMMMRSTKYPADMVFSAMGLFGVTTLKPKNFDRNDRIKPIIALAQEVLKQKRGATWLGVSFLAPPCPFLSTFPSFPAWSRKDGPIIAIPRKGWMEASSLMLNEYVDTRLVVSDPYASSPVSLPGDHMDNDGYLTLKAKALRVVRGDPDPPRSSGTEQSWDKLGCPIRATDGSTWHGLGSSQADSCNTELPAYAVLLGFFMPYNPYITPNQDCANIRGFIIVQNWDDKSKYSIDSYFMVSIKAADSIMKWEVQEFCVGGPYQVGVVDPPKVILKDDVRLRIPAPDATTTFANVDSRYMDIMKAGWTPVEGGSWREGGRETKTGHRNRQKLNQLRES